MPTVSSEQYSIKGIGVIQKKVNYSSKTGKFRIDLPAVIIEDMALPKDKGFVEATSEVEVNTMFKNLIKEWEEVAAKTTKVIVFEAEFYGAVYHQEYLDRTNNGKYKPGYKLPGYVNDHHMFRFIGADSRMDKSDIGLTLKWAVYEKREVKSNRTYKFIVGRSFDFFDHNSFGKNITEIPWTQDREDFFMEFDQKFSGLIEAIHAGIGNLTEDKLQGLMDGKQKLIG